MAKVPFPYLKTESWILVGSLLIALLLRVWGIGFGLPYIYHYDEHFYINTALNLGAGVLNNPPYAATGLSNVLFAEYALYYILGKVSGIFTSPQVFEMAFRADPTVIYTLGRLTSALFGTATVWAVSVLGKNAFSTKTGLLAAGFLAVSFLHIRESHYAVPDVAMSCLIVLSLALSVIWMCTQKKRYLYTSALIGGLATATKWTAAPVIASVWWASLICEDRQSGKLFNKSVASRIFLIGALFALGFCLGAPQIVIRPQPYVNEAIGQKMADQEGGFDIWQVDTVSGWVFYVRTLVTGVGVIMLGLAIVGLFGNLLSVGKPKGMLVLVLSFPIIYYVLMGATRHYFARYALPLVPFVALLAADGAVRLSSWLSQSQRWRPFLLIAVSTVAVVYPTAQSVRFGMLLGREDTRTTAKQWIEANVPAGARIAVDWPVHTPSLATLDRNVSGFETAYDVYAVGGEGLSAYSVDWYREREFDYLIASSFIYNLRLVEHERDRLRQDFYHSLREQLLLVYEIRPYGEGVELPFVFDEIYGPFVSLWRRGQPGPTIRIYAVQARAGMQDDPEQTVAHTLLK